jgi:glycosyltransferase involved in cell wall biosynthesis
MRVLHLIPSISRRRGGPSQAVLAMAAALRRQGVEASILTTNDDGPDRLPMPLGEWHEREGVPVLAFRRWSPSLPLLRPLREFAVSPPLARWLAQHLADYDLLHVHALFSFPSTAGMAVARRQHKPYLQRTIGQLQHWSLQQSAGRKQLLLRLIERRNLNGAAALHFTSAIEQQEAAALGLTAPSFVLPLGVDLPQLPAPPGPSADGPSAYGPLPVRWLFLSRLHPKKQLPLFFEALAELRRRRPEAPWRLDIAGEGEPGYLAELQQQASDLAIAHHLHWHGFVAGEAKAALLRQADWFVLPSAAENFGIAAAEALAAGTPVLLCPGVALADQVLEAGAGHVVQPTPKALARVLEDHCLQPPSPAMQLAARQLAAQRYSWDTIASRLIGHYESVLKQAPS